MNFLCIDYGLKRIGLAASDGYLARPLGTILNKGDKKNIEALKKYVNSETLIVCGMPYGNLVPEIERFAKNLVEELGAIVVYHDEQYTSQDAEAHIREVRGLKKREKVKDLIDAVAATMILQSYMGTKFYITDACINCGACADTCPVGAIEPKGTQHEIDAKCIKCGNCLGVCPVDAIKSGEDNA